MRSSSNRDQSNTHLFPSSGSIQRAAPNTLMPGGTSTPRRKVALKPGHSPLDWANLTNTTPSYVLRGVPPQTPPPFYIRISKEELSLHKTKEDCWTSIKGKVFNISEYVDFHPGGVEEIMKCAGKDGTFLFNKYHSWVNVDRMLEKCMVGVLANS
ncbi:Piso0_000282 [Millerozyma farinosa CBS 7064]|uniref:Piso0_000282 protein n=1 Tax=Pichia sorbitophila (strain ATCC MYA-4447 / BCRC 22081 / CBS 7064 / NBRC 10061 / NRRL Y-12695) TaxID=559304 RepID=G8YTK1_PICSO|nr:Piso0_000282 [Millerozyma farinosa CBS 7064]